MLKRDVLKHFNGSPTRVAAACKCSVAAVSQWPEIVPKGRAYQIALLTYGALEVHPEHYPVVNHPPAVAPKRGRPLGRKSGPRVKRDKSEA